MTDRKNEPASWTSPGVPRTDGSDPWWAKLTLAILPQRAAEPLTSYKQDGTPKEAHEDQPMPATKKPQKQPSPKEELTLSGEPIAKVQQAAAELREQIMQRARVNQPETEEDAVEAEKLRRLMVRRKMAAGLSQNSSPSPEATPPKQA